MLPPHIIEELRKREQYREDQKQEQPRVELEVPEPPRQTRRDPVSEERGIAIIDLWS